METQGPNTRAPVVAAFDAATGVREPVEFGIAASDVTGAPLIIAVVHTGDKENTLEQLRVDLQRRGLDEVEIRTFEDRTAARGLARALDEVQPALIVLGSSKRSAIGSVFVGTTAERVIHASSCPVAVVPKGYERPEGGVKVIGAAYSPSDEGREALQAAASLARAGGARVRAIMVLDPKHAGEQSSSMMAGQHHSTSASEGDAAVERLSDEAELNEIVAKLGVAAETDVLVADAADGLVAASQNVDLLIMGSRGLGPKRAVLLGSVSRRVAERSACPVVILPRGATEKTEALLADAEAHAAGPS
jgi:nucleotide-binding universal stress UspA family protein